MTDLIYNHISVRLPGPEHRFLLNPFGLLYEEVTASNLVIVGLDGQLVTDGPATRKSCRVSESPSRRRSTPTGAGLTSTTSTSPPRSRPAPTSSASPSPRPPG